MGSSSLPFWANWQYLMIPAVLIALGVLFFLFRFIKRKRLKVSLRTLLCLVLLIGSATALWLNRNPWRNTFENTELLYSPWVALSPDGKYIAGSAQRSVIVQNGRSQEILYRFAHPGEIRALAFTPDGRRVITSSWDAKVRVWDIQTGSLLFTLSGHKSVVTTLSLNQESTLLFTLSQDFRQSPWGYTGGQIKCWNLETGKEERRKPLSGKDTIPWDHSANTNRIALSSERQQDTLKIKDLKSGKDLGSYTFGGQILGTTFSPDGDLVAVLCRDYGLHIWNFKTGSVIKGLQSSFWPSFSPDGTRLVTLKMGGAFVHEVSTGKELTRLSCYNPSSASFAANGKRLAVGSHSEWGSGAVLGVWEQMRPESPWGPLVLVEFWITAVILVFFAYFLFYDIRMTRRMMRAENAPEKNQEAEAAPLTS